MALKLIYLVARNLLAWARLSRQDAAAKNVEILMLRHQLAIAQRRTPPRELHRKDFVLLAQALDLAAQLTQIDT